MKATYYGNQNFDVVLSSGGLANLVNKGYSDILMLKNLSDIYVGKNLGLNYVDKRSLFSTFFSKEIYFEPKKGFRESDFVDIFLTKKPVDALKERGRYSFFKKGSLIVLRTDNNLY